MTKCTLAESEFRELSENYLLPFFSGAKLSDSSKASTSRQTEVAFDGSCTILFKPTRSCSYRLDLNRKQPFDTDNSGRVTEKTVVSAFVNAVQDIESGLKQPYKDDLLLTLQQKVVVKSIVDGPMQSTLSDAIKQLSLWSERTYEGKPITVACGFLSTDHGGSASLTEICQEDFSMVLTNGVDTLLVCDSKGFVQDHKSLDPPHPPVSYSSFRHGAIAEWTKDNKVAVVLNQHGEILVLKNGRLLFARRSGKWHYIAYEPVLTQMRRPQGEEIRKTLYESSLDASFARTGACLGVVLSNHRNEWKSLVPEEGDHIDLKKSVKTKCLSKIIGKKKFQELDRRLRQELIAIDGATLIDHEGTILAVGAILTVTKGSKSGGRRSAAIAVSKLGLGIKVSQDGGIHMFRDGNDEPIISVM